MAANPKTIEMIKLVAHALGELNENAVFVGGATVPLYIPEQYWAISRATDDVDVVMEIIGHKENWKNEELLRKKGFNNDTRKGAPNCRWVYKGLTVDIMSSDTSALGFTNAWYKEGMQRALEIEIKPVKARIFSTPYFLASKIEAFKSRGNKDFMGSRDMEDIISVLEVCPERKLLSELADASGDLKKYLKKELSSLKANSDFLDAIPGAVFNRANPNEGTQEVLRKMDLLIK